MDGWLDGWGMDGWMDGWIQMDGWMDTDGWMDGWMDGRMNKQQNGTPPWYQIPQCALLNLDCFMMSDNQQYRYSAHALH